jgi:hypothetical protein
MHFVIITQVLCLGVGRGTVEEVVELSMAMTCWQVEDISEDKARETREDVKKLKLVKMTGVELTVLAR